MDGPLINSSKGTSMSTKRLSDRYALEYCKHCRKTVRHNKNPNTSITCPICGKIQIRSKK